MRAEASSAPARGPRRCAGPPGAPARAALVALATLLAGPARADAPDLRFGQSEVRLDGYVRIGFGLSRGGATQAAFQAPGARAKYRLGNEADTYFELAADYRYLLGEAGDPDTPFIQGYFMAAGYAPFGESAKLGPNQVAQAYVAFANVLPGLRVWLGRRYYDRKDIHLLDYFWLNTGQGAQAGAGVEGIRLGGSELKVAVFRLEDADAPEGGLLNSTSLDARLAGVRTNPGGTLTLWSQYLRRHANASPLYRERPGWGVGFWHDQDKPFGLNARNTLAVLYRHGPALTQSPYTAVSVREDQGYGLEGAGAWELNDTFVVEQLGRWALQWAAVLRWEDRGLPGGETVRWYSTGVRPLYALSEHVNVAVELGYDFVDNGLLARRGGLTKLTVALQLARGRGYTSRPVLRLFATGAQWSPAFEGLIGAGPGDAPYGKHTRGWTVGTQVESWW